MDINKSEATASEIPRVASTDEIDLSTIPDKKFGGSLINTAD
jgi:hypothetical protein